MININKLKFTTLQQEILRFLSVKAGVSFNIHMISKKLGVSMTAVAKSIHLLEKEELIKAKQDKESKRWSIELNRDNHYVIWLKRADNLRALYESGLMQFLYNKFPGTLIILFGSYSYGIDTYDSDIDIAIIGTKEKEISLKEYEDFLERDIFLQFYSSIKKIHRNLRNNIINGVVLKGVIEL